MNKASALAVGATVIDLQQYRRNSTSRHCTIGTTAGSLRLRIDADPDGFINYDWSIPPALADRLVDALLFAIVCARRAQSTQRNVSGSNS